MTYKDLLKQNAYLLRTNTKLLKDLKSRTATIEVLTENVELLINILAGNAPQQVSVGKTFLCYNNGSELVPNSNHYGLHRRRGQEPCKQSIREASAYHTAKKEQRKKRAEHEAKYNCEDREPVTPSRYHLIRHQRNGETPCEQSYKENAAAAYLKRNGTLEGWKYYTNKKLRRKD